MPNKKRSILIIEDNPADCRFIEELLKESGNINYNIQIAETLADGISKINSDIDVILLDLNLPDSNGIDTLKKTQQIAISTIIILSGIQDIDLANESIKCGAQDYLVKGTFDYNLLVRSINYSIERFKQNQIIIKNEENFRAIFETAPNLILILNNEKRIVISNDKTNLYLGYKFDEVLGKEITDFIHPENMETAKEFFKEVNDKGYVYNKECRMLRKDGSVINIFVNSSIYKTDKEKGIYTICIIDDITERKKYEAELIKSNNEIIKQRDLAQGYLNIAGVIIVILDMNGNVVLINKKGCEILGAEEKDIIGKNWFDNFIPHPLIEEIKKIHTKNISAGEFFDGYHENAVKTLNDEIKYIEWHNRVLKDDNNQKCAILSSGVDITERIERAKRETLVNEVLNILNNTNVIENAVRNILKEFKNSTNFESVAIRLQDGDDFPYYETNGFTDAFIKTERSLCARDKAGNIVRDSNGRPVLECMCGNVLCGRTDPLKSFFTKEGSFWSNSTTELLAATTDADRMAHTRNRCNSSGYESVALIPLKTGGEIIGLLQINDHRMNCFTEDMIHFFEGLGSSIGIALSRKKTEEALKESEVRYRRLFEAAKDGIIILDAETGMIVDVNPFLIELMGFSLDFLQGKAIWEIGFFKDIIASKAKFKELQQKKYIRYEDMPLKTADGKIKEVEFVSNVYLAGKKEVIQCNIRDITERKKAEEEIKFKNTILITQQEASIDGILAVDEYGKIISYNKRFISIMDIPIDIVESKSDELTIKSVLNKFSDPDQFLKKVNYLYEHHSETSFEEINMSDGRILERYSAPMIGQDGKYYGRIWYFRDITERKRSEKMFIESEKMAEVARLSAGVAHEFNNILAIIKSASQLLLLEESLGKITFDKRIKDELSIIEKQTNRGADIVSNLMTFSKPEKKEKEYIFIEDIINDVLKLQKKQFEIENIVITKKYQNKDKLLLNSSQMQQVFLNISINARHAIKPNGKGTIEIVTENDSKNVVVTFRDNGRGMNDEIKKNIFKPFFTTKGASANDDLGLQGTGLGLAVTNKIIKEYNGSISVESTPNKGTEFKIIFPSEKLQTEEAVKKENIKEVIMDKIYNKNINILIVDDEANIAENIAKILSAYGFKNIDVCSSSVDALKKLKIKNYELFFIDILMPVMTGDALIDKILSNKKFDSSNIIIMFGSNDSKIERITSSSEKCFLLKKPFSTDDILKILNKIFKELIQ